MKAVNTRKLLVYGLIAVMAFGFVLTRLPRCASDVEPLPPVVPTPPPVQVNVPPFNADSAYLFVKKQVAFGPRVPGTDPHRKCADWLVAEFTRFGLTVVRQPFDAPTYFGKRQAYNIIGQYKPELPNRVLLCAHWDSRHIADKDDKDQDKPILGADDGGSGVGVLLEIARLLQANPVDLGVDFVLFDAEDLGDDRDPVGSASSIMTQGSESDKTETWCLGSQYWARSPHKPNYSARFGILLDMVGASGARFPREGYSAANAPAVQNRIWNIARELGHENFFPNREGGYITDDHVFVVRGRNIPTVDIIGMPNEPPADVFGAHHHTHADDMDIISTVTLGAVGQVVTTVIYRTDKGVM